MATLCELTVMAKKNPKLSTEEFHRHWSEEHPKLFLSIPIVKEKIINYSQFHTDKAHCKSLEGFGVPVADYDGVVTLAAATLDDLKSVFVDPEYQKVVVPDEDYLFDRANSVMVIGYREIKKSNGKVMAGVLSP